MLNVSVDAGAVGAGSDSSSCRLRLHPMMLLDAAPYGSSSCSVTLMFHYFCLYFKFTNFEKSYYFKAFYLARIRIQVNPDPQPWAR
jgi:hypothetical protein